MAKRDLRAGEVLDGYGHFMTYGEAASAAGAASIATCRWGSWKAAACRDVPQDQALTCGDVSCRGGRMADRL